MFFITAFVDLDERYGTKGGSRCFGFKETFENADQAVRENWCDIHEYTYDYVIIEEMNPGIHPNVENRWFYKFNHEDEVYVPIDEPEELKHFCNLALG